MSAGSHKRKAEELEGEKESSSSSSSTSKKARTEKKKEERKDTSPSSMIVDEEPSEASSSSAKSTLSHFVDDGKSKLVSLPSGREQKGGSFPFGSSSPSSRKRKERDEPLSFPQASSSEASPFFLDNSKRIKLNSGESALIKALGRYYTHPKFSNIKRLFYENTFPISESFINLALVKEEEQKTKEKVMKGSTNQEDEEDSHPLRDELLLSYETLHTPKEKIELSELFNSQKADSKEAPKRLLIEGRAGIGKTTFCQYLAYQWVKGQSNATNPLKGWPKSFSALIWLPLRRLNEYKDSDVSLSMVVHRECLLGEDQERFSVEEISTYLKQLEEAHEVLYLLDGYDELEVRDSKDKKGSDYSKLISSLREKEWCIVTTRPYYVSNDTLWPKEQYRRLENIGFVDENVKAYVKRFFQDFEEEKQGEAVLQSFERYPMIKGLGHVPIFLELICSVWKEKSFKEAPDTLTSLYQEVTDWLFIRYLQRTGGKKSQEELEVISSLVSSEIEQHASCRKALFFLEELGWKGMKQRGLILKSEIYADSLIKAHCPVVKERPLFLKTVFKHLGFLKGVGEPKNNLMQQEHYFVHLTFQEFFAARYLVNSLKEPIHSKRYQEALQFIKDNKYHPRYLIMLSFTTGLLSLCSKRKEDETFIHRFWDTLLSEPYDLTGAGHLRLTMACLEETRCDERITQCQSLLKEVRDYLETRIKESRWSGDFPGNLLLSYQTRMRIIRHSVIQAMLVNGLRSENKTKVIEILGAIGSAAATPEVLKGLLICLSDKEQYVRSGAISVLGTMGSAAVTPEILKGLLRCLSDKDEWIVRSSAVSALESMGAAAAIPEVLKGLVGYLSDKEGGIRSSVASALGAMGSAAATPEILKGLIGCLNDKDKDIRSAAASALVAMGSAAAPPEVLKDLLGCLSDKVARVRSRAASALGEMGSAAATPEILKGLLECLSDKEEDVRSSAASALGEMGSTAATPEILKSLLGCLSDKEGGTRSRAVSALGEMGSAAATPEILKGLLGCLNDKDKDVRSSAASALGAMGSVAATPEVLKNLLRCLNYNDGMRIRPRAPSLGTRGLSDKDLKVRSSAASALGAMGSVAATPEVLESLVECLRDEDVRVRSSAVSALGEMGSVAATPEVLEGLVERLGNSAASALKAMGSAAITPEVLEGFVRYLSDEKRGIRSSTASALGVIGSAAATPEILKGLLVCLSDEDEYVRVPAVRALKKMGTVTGTAEILKGLLVYISKDRMNFDVIEIIDKFNWQSSALATLEASCVNLLLSDRDNINIALSSTLLLELMKVYFQTGYLEWAPVIARNAIGKGIAVTCNQWDVLIYDSQGSSLFSFPSEKRDILLGPLIQAFTNQAKKMGLPVRVTKESEACLSLTLHSAGGFMSGTGSSSSSSEVKLGISSFQGQDRLKLDFAVLGKMAQRIESEEVKKIIVEVLEHLQKQTKRFNDDREDSLSFELHYFMNALEALISYLTNKEEVITREAQGDSHSKNLALAILGGVHKEARRVYILLNPPVSPPSQPSYWQENRLRLEQQLLVGESKAAKSFKEALTKVATKGARDYRLPNGVFICYAWPDDKDSREEHLKWVQLFLVELRGHLRSAGIMAKLDIKDGPPGGNIYEYMKGAETSDYVLLIGTESLLKKHEKGVSAVCTELININHKRAKDRAAGKYRVLPVLISGDYGEAFPAHYELYTTMHDWKGSHTYYHHFCWLVRVLYGQENERAFDKEWNEFLKNLLGAERYGIVEPLDQKAVLAKMEAETLQKTMEAKQQELASRKVLGLSPGDSKSERSDGPSASGGSPSFPGSSSSSLSSSSASLSAAQLMARQRQHDSAYAVTFEGQLAFAEPSSSTRREDEQRKDAGKSFEGKHS